MLTIYYMKNFPRGVDSLATWLLHQGRKSKPDGTSPFQNIFINSCMIVTEYELILCISQLDWPSAIKAMLCQGWQLLFNNQLLWLFQSSGFINSRSFDMEDDNVLYLSFLLFVCLFVCNTCPCQLCEYFKSASRIISYHSSHFLLN